MWCECCLVRFVMDSFEKRRLSPAGSLLYTALAPEGKATEACLQRHGRAPDAISPIEFRFTCLTYKIRSWLQNFVHPRTA